MYAVCEVCEVSYSFIDKCFSCGIYNTINPMGIFPTYKIRL